MIPSQLIYVFFWGRLNDIKELKALSEKQLHNALRSLYVSLVLQSRQLSKELEVIALI